MSTFKTMTRIQGLSEVRRLPRVGKLRLGVKKRTQAGKEYPSEVPYFVINPEDCATPAIADKFRKVYGDKPTDIDIMFPIEDEHIFFPQAFKKYASTGLVCKGDGVNFSRIDRETGEILEGDCPTPEDCAFARDDKGRTVCKRIASIVFLLPKITWSGTWQIDTSSFNSIVDVNSAIDYFRGLMGRIAMVPLKLRRVARETQYEGKKATHYPMQLGFPDSREEVLQLGEQFQAVKAVFDIFNPRMIEGPSESIPEDLYPKDLVRKAQKALPQASVEPERNQAGDEIDGDEEVPMPASPPPQERQNRRGDSEQPLPGMLPDDPIEDFGGADLLLSDEERIKRTGAAVADMAKAQREQRAAAKPKPKPKPPAPEADGDDFFEDLV